MKICVIMPAAGASVRYQAAGAVRHKLDEDLGGKPLIQRTVETFTKFDDDEATIASILVAGPHDDADFAAFTDRHGDRLSLLGAKLVKGGPTYRWQTVAAAMAHVPEQCTHIAVHDAARPAVSFALLARVFRAARTHAAVVPAVSCSDTVKRAKETGETFGGDDPVASILGESTASKAPLRIVSETVDRKGLVLVQTPQVFRSELLKRAYAPLQAGDPAAFAHITDDASVVEATGERIVIVEGESTNVKVTLPADLTIARAVMGFREPEGKAAMRRF
ncbi:MAG: 2-C-methyl-D-erythritol 4-phosphate cytidylyltransferase [Phycisphaerae bacterium]|jgi:2-C-methyl-D-erythritol 4-phosphate cytidylyltransferase